MLLSITLKNYALATALDISFENGFNVITGETGAGKSLILDALSLSVGGRADASKVRHGCDKAEIYVEFDVEKNITEFTTWFVEQDIPESEQLLIRRQISANGRSKSWLNGTPISLAQLKLLGEKLVQMHSQHAQTALLKPATVLNWFDTVAQPLHKTDDLKHEMQIAWKNYHTLFKQITLSETQAAQRQTRINVLQMQLEDVQLVSAYNYSQVEAEHETLSNYEQLMREASSLLNLLESDDVSIHQMLGQSVRIAEQQNHTAFEQATNHIHTALAEVDEAIAHVRQLADAEAPDAQKLQQLDEQMGHFHRLARKYQVKPAELNNLAKDWLTELNELQALADETNRQQQLQELYTAYEIAAKRLDAARKTAAPIICETLLEKLRPIALENAQCQFEFTDLAEPNAKGISDIELLFSANKGMPLQPIQSQASGGELSRLALVMQVMNASQKQQALMVFDEVDVGISGGTAEIIGELMRELGTEQQILAITHQAQVAAKANHHLLVKKHDNDTQTQSEIAPISNEARVYELARMSGGKDINDTTLAHARQLLNA